MQHSETHQALKAHRAAGPAFLTHAPDGCQSFIRPGSIITFSSSPPLSSFLLSDKSLRSAPESSALPTSVTTVMHSVRQINRLVWDQPGAAEAPRSADFTTKLRDKLREVLMECDEVAPARPNTLWLTMTLLSAGHQQLSTAVVFMTLSSVVTVTSPQQLREETPHIPADWMVVFHHD